MLGPRSGLLWWLVGSLAAMVVGALGPWARVLGFVSVGGLDGDGWFVLVASVVSAALLFVHARSPRAAAWPLVGIVAAGVVATAVATIDVTELLGTQKLDGSQDGDDLASPGWGIWLSGIASVSLTLAAATRFILTGQPRQGVL